MQRTHINVNPILLVIIAFLIVGCGDPNANQTIDLFEFPWQLEKVEESGGTKTTISLANNLKVNIEKKGYDAGDDINKTLELASHDLIPYQALAHMLSTYVEGPGTAQIQLDGCKTIKKNYTFSFHGRSIELLSQKQCEGSQDEHKLSPDQRAMANMFKEIEANALQ